MKQILPFFLREWSGGAMVLGKFGWLVVLGLTAL